MEENNISNEERLLRIFRQLPPRRQEQIIDFAEFLVWKERKQNARNNENKETLVED